MTWAMMNSLYKYSDNVSPIPKSVTTRKKQVRNNQRINLQFIDSKKY